MERRTSDTLPPPALILKNDAPFVEPINYLTESKFVIGRGVESSLKLRQIQISRKHCTLHKVGPQKWTITAHRSNVVLNGRPLVLDDPNPLICGDKIKLAGVIIFEYKCAPDQNQHCCHDFKGNISENKSIHCESGKLCLVSSQLTASTSSNCSPSLITQPIDVDPVIVHTLNDSDSFASVIKMSDSPSPNLQKSKITSSLLILKSLKKYIGDLEAYVLTKVALSPKLIDELKFRINIMNQLHDFIVCRRSDTSLQNNEVIITDNKAVEALISFLKEKNEIFNCNDQDSTHVDYDEKLNRFVSDLDRTLLENMKLMLICLKKISDDLFNSKHCKCANNNSIEEEKSCESNINKKSENIFSNSMERQEAKIQLLEMKLKDKNKVEIELEACKEENEMLENKITELKRSLANMEVVELELKYLQETTKYKEDDKRSKDALEHTILGLKNDVASLKDENEKLTSSRVVLESDVSSLKQKCEELGKKCEELGQKLEAKNTNETKTSGCGGANTIDGSCCGMVREVKSSLMDLMEREFNCSICGDLFIEATVTNCNHVFCSHCLKEWKKKKKQCPFCRATINKECRAPIVDEYITNLSKLISEQIYQERMQMIQERKVAGTPPAKRARTRGLPRGRAANTAFVNPNIQLQNVSNIILNHNPHVPNVHEPNPSIIIL